MNADIRLSDYRYPLPDERIARFPLAQRDASKLLVYRQGQLSHHTFTDLPGQLPTGSYLVFNNTKVIPARLYFQKQTGAVIEVFLLHPVSDTDGHTGSEMAMPDAMQMRGQAIWHVMVGNRKRWKSAETLTMLLLPDNVGISVQADWVDSEKSMVKLSWQPAELTLAEVLQLTGEIPLPPYLKRQPTDADRHTYQTVYSRYEGAVAAPTAGLHFTSAILNQLHERGFQTDELTLHVGAGTFQPIKVENVTEHTMHSEQVVYSVGMIRRLAAASGRVVAVGTTSMRALESLYWIGVKLRLGFSSPFVIGQSLAYHVEADSLPTPQQSLAAVIDYLDSKTQTEFVAYTSIFIRPGYTFRIVKGLITNFHQPESTLMLLVAAFVGPGWKQLYNEALAHEYRFLSYGDSSLLLP